METNSHSPITSGPPAPTPVKVLIGLLLVLVVVVIVGYGAAKPQRVSTKPHAPAAVAPAVVDVTAGGFSPATVAVRSGQAVVWTNTDSTPHGVASSSGTGAPGFSSGKQGLTQSDSFSYVFSQPGTYSYHDALDPAGSTGTVIVK